MVGRQGAESGSTQRSRTDTEIAGLDHGRAPGGGDDRPEGPHVEFVARDRAPPQRAGAEASSPATTRRTRDGWP